VAQEVEGFRGLSYTGLGFAGRVMPRDTGVGVPA